MDCERLILCATRGVHASLWMALAVLAGCASPLAPIVGPVRIERPVVAVPKVAPAVQVKPADPELQIQPQVEPIAPAGPNLPYTVQGQTYEPVAADVTWKQRGRASWYGKNFNGRRTASGERFSAMGLTAAHRTLPIPSYIRVRHVASGQEVVVRVNDRGPFHANRVLDLSYAAAMKLGMVSAGSAEVEIERLTWDEIRSGAWHKDEPPLFVP